jgi:hypothetical protein
MWWLDLANVPNNVCNKIKTNIIKIHSLCLKRVSNDAIHCSFQYGFHAVITFA